jgi:hypothetical protein
MGGADQSAEPNIEPEILTALRNPQACLDGLPDELILEILSYLDENSFEQILQTNKRYKRTGDSLLFHEASMSEHSKMTSIANHLELARYIEQIRAGP